MKHLRLFENYKSDEEIHKICKEYNIKKYTINKDGSIDVDKSVDLKRFKLTELPLIFNVINGDFDCNENKLTTLKGSPRIINGSFYCLQNNLTNLIGGPDEVERWYVCSQNRKLTSLEGLAKSIGIFLDITGCNLSDFKGISDEFNIGYKIRYSDNNPVKYNIKFDRNPVYNNLKEFLGKYDINIVDIGKKINDMVLEINELDAIQGGKIIDIRMDEVLYNIGLI